MSTVTGPANSALLLEGLDGSNPLGFLAAVGVLRAASLADISFDPTMSWVQTTGGWRPRLGIHKNVTSEEFLNNLQAFLRRMEGHEAFARWENLGVPMPEFRRYALDSAADATVGDRTWADFAGAFGCDGVTMRDVKRKLVIEDTAFRTMSGAGHQHFLGVMRNVISTVTPDHLRRALFAPWDYADPMPNSTLRWDPADDARHALQWRNPSGDPARRVGGTMLGATRLAIEGLPLFPTGPRGIRLATAGFTGKGRRDTFLTWPIWEGPVGINVCRSILALAELQMQCPDPEELKARGIVSAFRSQRITQGKFRNLTPARRVA